MKRSSNIDPGATREQLEGYYREIVSKWGEISDQPFIFYGSSLHVQALTDIFINSVPSRSFLYISNLFVANVKVKSLCDVIQVPCDREKCSTDATHQHLHMQYVCRCKSVGVCSHTEVVSDWRTDGCVCRKKKKSCNSGRKYKNACSLSISHFGDSFILK